MSKKKEDKEPENKKPKKDKKKVEKKKLPQSLLKDIIQPKIMLLQVLIRDEENKKILQIFRKLKTYRKILNAFHLSQFWNTFFPNKCDIKFDQFADYEPSEKERFDLTDEEIKSLSKCIEIELYCRALTLMYLVKQKQLDKAKDHSLKLIRYCKDLCKRYLDSLQGFVFFYYSRTMELLGKLNTIRPMLFDYYRRTCIKHDEFGQATVINLILRNYLQYNHYQQASKFMDQSSFPESISNNENVRYLYYTALIKTVQLEYQEAFARVIQAIRKCPEKALSFKISAQKLAVVVELLLGQIPNKNLFSKKIYQQSLFPYYRLCESVYNGNLEQFSGVVEKYSKTFERDGYLILIKRLTQNVIKTGLRRINSSYSKIHFTDVASKLHLNKLADVEFIIAKAVRDKVITAKLNHEGKFLEIQEKKDEYSTDKPKQEFERRLNYCLHVHTKTQKALEYPEKEKKYHFALDEDSDDENEMTIENLLKMLEDM